MPYEVTLPPKPHRGRLTEEEEIAYIEQLTDEQRVIYLQRKEDREAQSVVGRTGTVRRRRADGLDADVSVSELSEILRYIFEGIATLLRSETEWSDDEFKTISKGMLIIINRIQRAKIVVRMLTPVASAAQLVSKFRKLFDGTRKQPNNTT